MKYLTRMLALTRLLQLKRQWKHIAALLAMIGKDEEQVLAALVFGEVQRASKHPMPLFYASQGPQTYRPWGTAVDVAFDRIRCEDRRGRMHGIATWLTVVYHETANSPLTALRELHKDVAYELNKYRALRERVLAIRMAA